MIYKAEICNERSIRTVGYDKPIIQLREPRVYTSPISGDLIRIEAPDNLFTLLKSFTKTTVSDWMRRNQSEELADWLSDHKKFDVQREELAKQNLKDLAKDLGYNIKTIELE